MDAGLLSFTNTLRSYFDHKNHNKRTTARISGGPLDGSEESDHSDGVAVLSTPSNSWQASVYPSESALESNSAGGFETPRASFDTFIESGHAVTEFDWVLERAQGLSLRNIREWRGERGDASFEELDTLLVERRTNLWRIVLAQRYCGHSEAPFTAPVAPDTRQVPYVLRPSNNGTHWCVPLQVVHTSPLAIPEDLAAEKLYDTSSLLA